MAKKEKENNKVETEFHKKIRSLLNEHGFANASDDSISFMVENNSEDVVVDYNCMSTGIHFNKKDIDKQEVIESGFHYYSTWNYGENC